MKTGLICPIPHLGEFGTGEFSLILDHLCEIPEYLNHYKMMARKGAHIMLDNSAHEFGQGNGYEQLLERATEIGARELVCPDQLFSSTGTIMLTTQALNYYHDMSRSVQLPQLVLVPQGESIYEWGNCLNTLVKAFDRRFPGQKFTIGISKDYEMWPRGLTNLLTRFIRPLRADYSFDVHLLGWGRDLAALSSIAANFPWIRSVDSAKPFVYASNEIALTLDAVSPEYPKRSTDYFFRALDDRQLDIARHNVKIFQTRANHVLA